ncbi:MAG: hypothetical protein PUG74_07575 [Prevotellaceae bacterium]|nr:hypothetical protein [Prevotellaceae bacterium]
MKWKRHHLRKKKRRENNRKRNHILNFKVSEEEYELINKKIELSQMSKQDYFIKLLTEHEINVYADYRVADAIAKEIFQLARVIKKVGKLNEVEDEILLYILEIYEEIKKEKSL